MPVATQEPHVPSSEAMDTSMTKFSVFFTGQTMSLFGSQLVQFALVWWLTRASGLAVVLTTATLVAIVPRVIIGPIAGTLVDRWNRRLTMIGADGMVAGMILVLAFLFIQGTVQIEHIYLLIFVRSIGGAFHWPAVQASTSMLVPKKHLSRVAGIQSAVTGISGIAAPLFGALLLELFPIQHLLMIDLATAALAIIPLLAIRIPSPPRTLSSTTHRTSVLTDLREVFRYLWHWKPGLFIMLGAMVINLLLTPAFSLIPFLAFNHFNVGVQEFAWLQAASGLGMIVGGLILGAWGGFRRRIVTAMSTLIIAGGGFCLVGITPATIFYPALIGLFIASVMMPIVNGSLFAIYQSMVPKAMQGRMFTLLMTGSSAIAPLGLILAGPLADLFGAQLWFIAAGICMALIGIIAFLSSTVMHIEDTVSPSPLT